MTVREYGEAVGDRECTEGRVSTGSCREEIKTTSTLIPCSTIFNLIIVIIMQTFDIEPYKCVCVYVFM